MLSLSKRSPGSFDSRPKFPYRKAFVNVLPALLAQTVQADSSDERGWLMSIIVWLVVGLVAGFLASKVVNRHGEGLVRDILLGLVGSIVGGFIIHLLGFHRNGSIILSIIVAMLGAILVLVVYHKLIRARRPA